MVAFCKEEGHDHPKEHESDGEGEEFLPQDNAKSECDADEEVDCAVVYFEEVVSYGVESKEEGCGVDVVDCSEDREFLEVRAQELFGDVLSKKGGSKGKEEVSVEEELAEGNKDCGEENDFLFFGGQGYSFNCAEDDINEESCNKEGDAWVEE